jgi:phosphoenolpyruvate synthase/pyruvate phosphate dikinase
VEIFLLGAGKPATGQKPAALKNIASNTKALDWQIHSFDDIRGTRIHFLGGYHVEEVIENYPELSYTVVPEWQSHTALHTFFQAPFSQSACIVAYSDTVFRKEIINALCQSPADIAFGIDTNFKQRYESRSADDLASAETIFLENFALGQGEVEFTGLIHFSPKVVAYLHQLKELSAGKTLRDLLNHLATHGFSVEAIETQGHWAEFNSPADIAHFILGTKADTLARLKPLVRYSHIGDQVTFTAKQFQTSSDEILSSIQQTFKGKKLVVRSSANGEDNWHASNAGGFASQLNVDGQSEDEIKRAIIAVIQSYGENSNHAADQVLVQPFIEHVACSGVVFTCSLETGAPYYRFNFDDQTQSTESVTAGTHDDLRTIILHRNQTDNLKKVEPKLLPVLKAIKELEKLLGFDRLDIEFAIDRQGVVHIFQVRPITVDHSQFEVPNNAVSNHLAKNCQRFNDLQHPSPFLLGNRTFFGNMPDWNPAEIIGARPKPLAFSLYRYLITNEIWATQRAEFGYRDIRPHPLIVAFSGQPYVDIRASLNSFIPATLPDELATNLVQTYLQILADHPEFHDKIEFNVAFTIWTPTFEEEARNRLYPYGFTPDDITQLDSALKVITRNALTRLDSDIAPIEKLIARRKQLEASQLSPIDKVTTLLDDCRRLGTLAFAHAARAGFVATTFLKSFVSAGILSEEKRLAFMCSIQTVAGQFEADKHAQTRGKLEQTHLVEKYGHLRPGTYDINAQAYWEDPARYLTSDASTDSGTPSSFKFSEQEQLKISQVLQVLGSDLDVSTFIQYLSKAIQAREAVKFEFTRNLSCALDLCVAIANDIGLSREEIAFLEYHDLEQFKLNIIDINALKTRVTANQQAHIITQLTELPTLITSESDFHCFERHASQPNFITTQKTTAHVKLLNGDATDTYLENHIILIPQADPGYDWLFGHNIAGLITQYGGANSHMAIRAAEMGLPAAIGVGEKLYEAISQMKQIELDCDNQTIKKIA